VGRGRQVRLLLLQLDLHLAQLALKLFELCLLERDGLSSVELFSVGSRRHGGTLLTSWRFLAIGN
jgi:hypothetical protein